MGTEKRERQKANKAARLAAQEAAEAKKRRIRFIRNVIVLVIAIIVVGFLLAGCSDSDSGEDAQVEAGGGATDADDTTDAGASGEATYGTTACPPADGVDEPRIDFETGFERCIDPAKTYTAVIETTEGTITVDLDTERTPITTNNFVALARYGYYDDTDLFRTEADSGIIQGGAPHSQDSSDPGPGPNFFVPDEGLPFSADDYGPGTLAMARTAEPDSASGQFFLLASEGGRYLGDPAQLGPDAGSYAAFGTTTDGLDVLAAIAALDDGTRQPSKPVSIETITITES